MADELARAYFEKLKAAEQQIFELRLELAKKVMSTGHVAIAVANSQQALKEKISLLEEDNARLRDGPAATENDIEGYDDEDDRVVMCHCGVDLLGQMQENKAPQQELETQKLKYQAMRSQLKNLRTQIVGRDERISTLAAEKVVRVKDEEAETQIEPSLKRRRVDTDNGPQSTASPEVDYRQHPSRAVTTSSQTAAAPDPGPSLPTPVRPPHLALRGNYVNAVPNSAMSTFASNIGNTSIQQPLLPSNVGSAPNTYFYADMPPHVRMASSMSAPGRGPIPMTRPDIARPVRKESAISKRLLESSVPPQGASTDSHRDNNDHKGIIVDGFPNPWRLSSIKEYLVDRGFKEFTVQRPKQPQTKVSFLTKRAALYAVKRLNGMSANGQKLSARPDGKWV
ncbi:hypothetical protein DOTSEDRAFT_70818 [Dothistroma septosporum NZE10]|uniref:RRM domain-containing protein n=1 Tax=Dothistroma septosporum (strain NZE10 / CBS 128990) TaxID=675120 RepID=N1PPN3_DOTSN|nr:hypothetical protein DOTSEDRAFT_70818 [Dothistroma septosporum NZE10]